MFVVIVGTLYAAGLAFLVPGLLSNPVNGPFVVVGSVLLVAAIAMTVAASPLPRRIEVAYWHWRGIPTATNTVDQVVKRAPERPNEILFTTNAREPRVWRVSEIGNLPTRITFQSPEKKTVYRTRGLPADIKCKLGSIRVSHFEVGGFVVDEQGCKGDKVWVEVYFD